MPRLGRRLVVGDLSFDSLQGHGDQVQQPMTSSEQACVRVGASAAVEDAQ
jgi:hypothetical protein